MAWSLMLVIILLPLIGGALAIGQAQPTPERITRLHLADCALPCWNGVTPGVSSVGMAQAQIDAILPYFHRPSYTNNSQFLIWTAYGDIDRVVRVVNVMSQNGLAITIGIGTDHTSDDMPRLSEVLAVFGVPSCVEIDEFSGYTEMYYENEAQQPMLTFTVYPLSLETPINNLILGFAPNGSTCQNTLAASWRDFLHLRPDFLSAGDI